MTSDAIIPLLREAALALRHNFNPVDLRFVDTNRRGYTLLDFPEFKRDLLEAGRKIDLLILEYQIPMNELAHFLKSSSEPILLFEIVRDNLNPILSYKKGRIIYPIALPNTEEKTVNLSSAQWMMNENNEMMAFVIMPFKSVVSNNSTNENNEEPLSPTKRLYRLLTTEKKDIAYVLLYSIIIGLVSLILPLGLQTTVELISGGVFFSSVYILIGLVIVGVMITGGLQIVQISLVEHLQRRVFTKAAFEFAFRIPRICMESLMKNYAPELVNRFFDVITIQKGLPKLLIDLSAGAIQIFFGLLLLSLYHPFFVFFGFFLLLILGLLFVFTGSMGLKSSLSESKYKYKVVQWLEELARVMNPFKLAGNTNLPIKYTDFAVSNYLKYRKTHFTILQTQLSFF